MDGKGGIMLQRKKYLVILCLLFCACKETILHDLTEFQANRAYVALIRHGLEVSKTDAGDSWEIAVDKSNVPKALVILEASRLLKHDISKAKHNSSSFIQSKEEQTQWLTRQKANQLEQTLETYPGVVEARVHLHYTNNKNYFEPAHLKSDSSASVLLISEESLNIPNQEIHKLIFGATGIPKDNISVVKAVKEHDLPQIEPSAIVPNQSWLNTRAGQLMLTLSSFFLLAFLLFRLKTSKKRTFAPLHTAQTMKSNNNKQNGFSPPGVGSLDTLKTMPEFEQIIQDA